MGTNYALEGAQTKSQSSTVDASGSRGRPVHEERGSPRHPFVYSVADDADTHHPGSDPASTEIWRPDGTSTMWVSSVVGSGRW